MNAKIFLTEKLAQLIDCQVIRTTAYPFLRAIKAQITEAKLPVISYE